MAGTGVIRVDGGSREARRHLVLGSWLVAAAAIAPLVGASCRSVPAPHVVVLGHLAGTSADTLVLAELPSSRDDVTPTQQQSGPIAAYRAAGGRVIVTGGGVPEVVFVAAGGRTSTVVNTSNVTQVQHAPDGSVNLFDSGSNTVTRVGADGRMVRLSLPPEGDGFPVGYLRDGTLVTARSGDPAARWQVDSVAYRFTDSTGRSTETRMRPGVERRRLSATSWAPLVYAAHPLETVHGDHLHAAFGGAPELATYDGRGSLVQLITWRAVKVPVSVADGQEEGARSDQGDAAVRPEGPRSPLMRTDVRRTLPIMRRLLAGRDSTIWVELYPAPRQGGHQWIVFADDGRLVGRLSVPSSYALTEVSMQEVLGIWRGSDMRVVEIRGYQIHRRAVARRAS